jgi:anti-anti-sigma factor|tara:strand:+ start:203 stop:475 length:273 start_codon:yes stop_codon:yes gene_type:complete
MGSCATIQLDADLTISQVGVWHARLADESLADNEVVIDASELVRVDASGLQLLLAFKKTCAENNIAMALFNVPKTLQELIRVSGLSQELG